MLDARELCENATVLLKNTGEPRKACNVTYLGATVTLTSPDIVVCVLSCVHSYYKNTHIFKKGRE